MDNDGITTKRRFLVNIAFWSVIIALVFFVFRYLLNLLMPFFLALIFAALSRPLSRYLSSEVHWKKDKNGGRIAVKNRVRFNQTLAIVLSVLLIYLIFAGLLVLFIVRVSNTTGNMIAALPELYSTRVLPVLESSFDSLAEWAGKIDDSVLKLVEQSTPNLISSLGSAVTKFSVSAVTWISSLAGRLPTLIINTLICLIATMFIALDFDAIRGFIRCNLPEKPLQMVIDVKDTFLDIIWQFIRSYFAIFLITATEITVGLLIIGKQQALFIGMMIAVFDAFPIVGSGMVLLPWSIFTLAAGDIWNGVGLALLYIVVVVVRQIIEPKIVGKHVGMRPIVTLVTMYAGTRLFGGIGLFALPIMTAILTDLNDRGLIHLFTKPESADKETA